MPSNNRTLDTVAALGATPDVTDRVFILDISANGLRYRTYADLLDDIEADIQSNWQGQWLTATGYVVADEVFNDGSSYICILAHTSGASTEPGTGASWTTYWDLRTSPGTGDVTGPASATDNAIVRFDTTSGDLIQNSGVTIDDSNNLTVPGTITVTNNASLHRATNSVNDLRNLDWTAQDSLANTTVYARAFGSLVSATDAAEKGKWTLQTMRSGTLSTVLVATDSGNLLLGTTTEYSWVSTAKAIQFGDRGTLYQDQNGQGVSLTSNVYFNAGEKYVATDTAQILEFPNDGSIRARVAASGTAGTAITFTTGWTIAASTGKFTANQGIENTIIGAVTPAAITGTVVNLTTAGIGLSHVVASDTNLTWKADTNRTTAGSGILNIDAHWNGTRVGLMQFQSGADTVNKDDGRFLVRTATGGVLTGTFFMNEIGNVGFSSTDLEATQAGYAEIHYGSHVVFSYNQTALAPTFWSNNIYLGSDGNYKYRTTNVGALVAINTGGTITVQTFASGTIDTTATAITALTITNAGLWQYSLTNHKIVADTADAADNKRVNIAGGGDAAASRGAYIQLHGNEHASTGILALVAGDVTGGHIQAWTGTGGGVLRQVWHRDGYCEIYNATTAPSASVANGVILYAEDVTSSSELKVRDEAGNITVLSPHTFSLTKPSEPMAWCYHSERDGQTIEVDMLRVVRLLEEMTGEQLVHMKQKLAA